jgi:OOP family OmpA-OmpF porin
MADDNTLQLSAAMPVMQDEAEARTFPSFEPVQFDFDSNEISDYAKEQLMPLVGFATDHSKQQIILTGHTDNVGPEAYNQQLSLKRAEAIRKFLLQQGIDQKMIKVLGAGEKRPVQSNRTASGRKTNRRVEIAVA